MVDRRTGAAPGAETFVVPNGFSGTLIRRFEGWKGAGIMAQQAAAEGLANQEPNRRMRLEGISGASGSGITTASSESPFKPNGFYRTNGALEVTVFQPHTAIERI